MYGNYMCILVCVGKFCIVSSVGQTWEIKKIILNHLYYFLPVSECHGNIANTLYKIKNMSVFVYQYLPWKCTRH